MTTSKLLSLIGMRSISKGQFSKIRVQPWITVLVPTRFPSAISMSYVVSSVIGGILSLETRDMDTKLLSAPESNNTLARCWFRRNVPVASSGWPFVYAVPCQMTHLVASLTLNSARSCVMQGTFLTQGKALAKLSMEWKTNVPKSRTKCP
ncbi:hypothetical protein Tco_0174657 [Tanacetum coccineum]